MGATGARLVARMCVVMLLGGLVEPGPVAQGRRVVDVVRAGDAESERAHDFAGEHVTAGLIDGRIYWQARGWLSYVLAVYEDTEVTLGCTFRGSEGRKLPFDLLVEGRQITVPPFVSPSAAPATVEFVVPFQVTKGLTSIHVVIRAVDGPTPGLMELRTVQEHLEQPAHRAQSERGAGGVTFW